MGMKASFIVLLVRPHRNARLAWWPRVGNAYCWVTVHDQGWSMGTDIRHKISARDLKRLSFLKENFLDEYDELRGPRGAAVEWEWKTENV